MTTFIAKVKQLKYGNDVDKAINHFKVGDTFEVTNIVIGANSSMIFLKGVTQEVIAEFPQGLNSVFFEFYTKHEIIGEQLYDIFENERRFACIVETFPQIWKQLYKRN